MNVVVVGSRVQHGYFLRERLDEFLGSSEGCVDTLLRGVDHVLDIEDNLSGLFEPLHLRCVN